MIRSQFLQFYFSRVLEDVIGNISIGALPANAGPDELEYKNIERNNWVNIDLAIQRTIDAGYNSYYGTGIVSPAAQARGKTEEILALPAVWAELDVRPNDPVWVELAAQPNDPEALANARGKYRSFADAEAALNAVPLIPTAVLHSGGGYQGLWMLEEPIYLSGDNLDTTKKLLKAFVARVNGDPKAALVTQYLRLPGTRNVNHGTPLDAELLVWDGPWYPLREIAAWLGTPAPSTSVSVTAPPPAAPPTSALPFLPLDIVELRKRLRARKYDRIRRELDGASLGPDGRNNRLVSVFQTLANVLPYPERTDPEELAQLYAACLAATEIEDAQPGKPAPTMDHARRHAETGLTNTIRDRARDAAQLAEIRAAAAARSSAAEQKYKRPTIHIDPDELSANVSETEEAIAAYGLADPDNAIFSRGEVLVDVRSQEDARDADVQHHAAPRARPLPAGAMWEAMARAAKFAELRGKGEDQCVIPREPPEKIGRVLVERKSWSRLRPLNGIVEVPQLLADGRILDTPGYDARSGLLYLPSAAYPPVPVAPTLADAQAAAAELLDWSCQVTWRREFDRSAVLALLLTGLSRYAIRGPVPMFTFSAPTRASGKTLVASCAIMIAQGRDAATAILSSDESEVRKTLLAIGISGAPVVLFDDVENSVLRTSSLSGAITSPSSTISDRLLGQSERLTVPMKTIFVATANNFSYADTMARRVVECTIDPGIENPELRGGWKYPDLLAHVRKHRARLAACGLTILRAHVQAGRPPHSLEPMGSFEAWEPVVRSAITWLGLADPCGARDHIRAESDTDRQSLRQFMLAWHGFFAGKSSSISGAITAALSGGVRGMDLREALQTISSREDPAQIGQQLARWRDQIVDGLKLTRAIHNAKTAHEWCVVPVGAAAQQVTNVIQIPTRKAQYAAALVAMAQMTASH